MGCKCSKETNNKPYTFEDLQASPYGEREGCQLTLYRDSHASDPAEPDAWNDMVKAINEARQFVLICAWSCGVATSLIRTGDKWETFGEMMKRKADEGVQVLLHVWDEATSFRIGGIKVEGLAGTKDEEARVYFEGSKVHMQLSTRDHSREADCCAKLVFFHHQKTIVCDAPPVEAGLKPRVVAFVGGLDPCQGRYDTPQHPLFGTLQTVHRGDYYNGCFKEGSAEVGPREPWHDLHARVEGPAAWDVLDNFAQRWAKQARDRAAMPALRREDYDLRAAGGWRAEIVRSIDEHSALGVAGVEAGIQRALVAAVRGAREFVYVENQYFCGSSSDWPEGRDVPCCNLVPREIAARVCRAVAAGEAFRAYVVLPLYPEGVPASAMMQEILLWQRRTMRAMYARIADALRAAQAAASPTDYLQFYCLGARELPPPECLGRAAAARDDYQRRACRAGRFMVYVHAKLLIADDARIVIGSANTNERSLAGDRDTDLAVAAAEADGRPDGAVHRFRRALWAEHAGVAAAALPPAALDTARALRGIGERNWAAFAAEPFTPMESRLMAYPIRVGPDGAVESAVQHFPDTEALVCGSGSICPDILTT